MGRLLEPPRLQYGRSEYHASSWCPSLLWCGQRAFHSSYVHRLFAALLGSRVATMQCPTLDAARAACELPLERLHTISQDMVHEMRQGLAADGCQLMMLPSHVTSLPDGCVSQASA